MQSYPRFLGIKQNVLVRLVSVPFFVVEIFAMIGRVACTHHLLKFVKTKCERMRLKKTVFIFEYNMYFWVKMHEVYRTVSTSMSIKLIICAWILPICSNPDRCSTTGQDFEQSQFALPTFNTKRSHGS
ncbi:hypothetical protein BCR42DRAFT_390110 [Absidia repens]|uniref:Uncharacterized protein n=1 Tax=Absidia repens TaxID=90262 RepID=A0A1X2IN47_9FUNG|nr:hypothetical protein BCR42DRAFT_390110 [Absidia repens]